MPNRHDQNRTSPQHIIVKTLSTQNKERILKPVREKHQNTYKNKSIIVTDFSTENLKTRRAWSEVFHALKENNFKPRLLYPEKL
jgi:tRNA A37 threonylcarbamoyladenosine dehydratase